jgi:hypothetical protein
VRIEHLPILLGVIIAVWGGALIYDAWRAEGMTVFRERRRRQRAERNRPGEALIGLGTVLLGAALAGRDVWRFATLAVIFGFALVLIGAALNRDYLRELLLFRGAARRAAPGEKPPTSVPPPPSDYPRPRIR